MKLKLLSSLAILLVFSQVHAEAVDAKVTRVGTYAGGRVFIYLDKQVPQEGCQGKYRVDLPYDHSNKNTIMSIVLTAHTSNKTVRLETSECYQGHPTLAGQDSHISVLND